LLAAGISLAARAAGAQSGPANDRPKEGDLLVKVDSIEPIH
jgi:hypothetical protein